MNTKKGNPTTPILAGDVGGTKTILGLFDKGARRPILIAMEIFPSQAASSLEEIITRFLEIHRASVCAACFGVPGPVRHGQSRVTNLPWFVSEKHIQRRFHWDKVLLINDVTATALSIPFLLRREISNLNDARAQRGEPIGLVAPGTGMGQALMVFAEGRYVAVPSEGGHVDFAPTSEAQVDLWRFLHRKWGHVSLERVLSGPGLRNIYSWVKASGKYREPKWLAQALGTDDPAKVISESALAKKSPLCVQAVDTFVRILGSACGNLALTALTYGGLYLGGGIPPKILASLKGGPFSEAFINKGRFRSLLEKIPLRVILNDRAALLGAAASAFAHQEGK